MPNKVVDMNALHRNEITHEVEGEEDNQFAMANANLSPQRTMSKNDIGSPVIQTSPTMGSPMAQRASQETLQKRRQSVMPHMGHSASVAESEFGATTNRKHDSAFNVNVNSQTYKQKVQFARNVKSNVILVKDIDAG